MPKITCVMAVYNTPLVVEMGVCSVLHQTFKDFELIIIDDSTDETPEVIAALVGSDRRVVHIRESRRLCVPAKWDMAAGRARGEWIAQFDADDYHPPCRLGIQLATMEAAGPSFGLCHIPRPYWCNPAEGEGVWQHDQPGIPLQGVFESSFFYPREVWSKIGGNGGTENWQAGRPFLLKLMRAGLNSVAAPSDYSEHTLGIEHGRNMFGRRLHLPVYRKTALRWRDMLSPWALEVCERLRYPT